VKLVLNQKYSRMRKSLLLVHDLLNDHSVHLEEGAAELGASHLVTQM